MVSLQICPLDVGTSRHRRLRSRVSPRRRRQTALFRVVETMLSNGREEVKEESEPPVHRSPHTVDKNHAIHGQTVHQVSGDRWVSFLVVFSCF